MRGIQISVENCHCLLLTYSGGRRSLATKIDLYSLMFRVSCQCVKRVNLHTPKRLLDYHEEGGIRFHRNDGKNRHYVIPSDLNPCFSR